MTLKAKKFYQYKVDVELFANTVDRFINDSNIIKEDVINIETIKEDDLVFVVLWYWER